MTHPKGLTRAIAQSTAMEMDTETALAYIEAKGYHISEQQLWTARWAQKKKIIQRMDNAVKDFPDDHLNMCDSLRLAQEELWRRIQMESSGRTTAELIKALTQVIITRTGMNGATPHVREREKHRQLELASLR